jgi:hypothetical protein
MWCRQNEDTSWLITKSFSFRKNGKTVRVNESTEPKDPINGFHWESDQAVLDGYEAHNAALEAAAQ